jgi:microcystin-dependent protein
MNKLQTTENGGFPFRLDDIRWMQNGLAQAFKGIMSSYGVLNSTAVILSGCVRTSASGTVTVTEGYVSIGGEICYSPAQSYPAPTLSQNEWWVIDVSYDSTGLKTFQDASNHDTYEVRTAKIQVGTTVPSGFTKYSDTKTIFDVINANTDTVPQGVIMMWSGAIVDIPTGYKICDGTNGTPDLRGRFVVGYDSRTTQPISTPHWDANYNAIGNTGGAKNVTLSLSQMPNHQHRTVIDANSGGEFDMVISPGSFEGTSDADPGVRGTTGLVFGHAGLTQAHENRPAYFVIAYIMKTTTNTPIVIEPETPGGGGLEG